MVLGGGAIAGLVALHEYARQLAASGRGGDLAAFDLTGRGSLGAWFASMLLAAAALASLVVYSVRRFKLDDRRGHYRVWLWAAACWLLLSIDTIAGLHHAFAAAVVSATGTKLWGDGSIWWVVGYGFLLGGIGTRLLVDMRACRLAAAGLLLALGCYAAAVAGQFGWVQLPPEIDTRLAIRTTVLSGNLLALLAIGLQARHVVRDARGLLQSPAKQPPAAAPRQQPIINRHPAFLTPTANGNSLAVHPPQGVPAPNAPSYNTSYTPPAAQHGPCSILSTPPPVARKLTKQEKKVLRERLERARRDREARGV